MSDKKAAAGHFKRIRRELCAMLGYGDDPDALAIDRAMRLDVVFGLKLSTATIGYIALIFIGLILNRPNDLRPKVNRGRPARPRREATGWGG